MPVENDEVVAAGDLNVLDVVRLRFAVVGRKSDGSRFKPLQLVIDFWTITVVLARRLTGRDVGGRFVVRPFQPKRRGPTRAGDVAWRMLTATISPNALVIDVDLEERASFFHDLVVNRRSEEPA